MSITRGRSNFDLDVPAGTYTSYEFSTDWSPLSGGPFSSEAIWAITDEQPPFSGAETFYADPGSSPDSAGNSDSATLTWDGFMDVPLTSTGLTDDFFLLTLQTFAGSSATWANTSLSLGFDVAPPVVPPAATEAFIDANGSVSASLDAAEVLFYEFESDGVTPFSFDTFGSFIPGGTFGDTDTEIAVFDAAGDLVAANDDIPNAGFGESELIFTDVPVASNEFLIPAAGTYYLAVGAFNTEFADGFSAVSTSTAAGTVVINGLSVIPEPTSLAAPRHGQPRHAPPSPRLNATSTNLCISRPLRLLARRPIPYPELPCLRSHHPSEASTGRPGVDCACEPGSTVSCRHRWSCSRPSSSSL